MDPLTVVANISSPAIVPTHRALAVKNLNEDMSGDIRRHINYLEPEKKKTSLGLVTRKEWVLPPRPKPGRKPATDTPPTKRKAQNRAAQRAFRERRAARVGELEVQLEEAREEQQNIEAELRSKIKRLEAEVGIFKNEIDSWKSRCNILDSIVVYEKRAKEAALAELTFLREGAQAIGTDSVPLPFRMVQSATNQQDSNSIKNTLSDNGPDTTTCGVPATKSEGAQIDEVPESIELQCGNCTLDSSCACLEEAIKESLTTCSTSEYKRSHSPTANNLPDKRSRPSESCTSLEIDFTTQFASKGIMKMPALIEKIPPIESCGFCDDGTYCLCAEAIATGNEQRVPFISEISSSTLASASDSKQPFYQKILPQQEISKENGPGTCQQCLADPRSGKFCRSLSALRESDFSKPLEGCCKKMGSLCCMSTNKSPMEPPRLSCADAYKTLSSHKNYDQADDELDSWLGRLNAIPPAHPGRGALEVEAASVMEVLKLFDRRFKKNKDEQKSN
ncbi:putative bzip transcription factor [Golovinomyces cichoracearum]|uniref:Putative bzip transcription factor n=1 Tax=Golovinomyces cichoracearum TaxID=62708 RepID=A0A420IH11_9PEZI|nr:putative bzip transcription factor [Golovinomyces cichoracearum]